MGKYQKNEIVECCVTGTTNYGIFVSLDEYYSGLIHISEICNDFVRDINSVVDIGETINARVLESDDDSCHVKLSIKGLNFRINSDNIKIRETKHGFNTLKKELENWILCKQKEKKSKT